MKVKKDKFLNKFLFHLKCIFADPHHWFKWKIDQAKTVWVVTRVAGASLLIVPYWNLKWSSKERERKKKTRE